MRKGEGEISEREARTMEGLEDGVWLRSDEDGAYEEGMREDGDESGNGWRHGRTKERVYDMRMNEHDCMNEHWAYGVTGFGIVQIQHAWIAPGECRT